MAAKVKLQGDYELFETTHDHKILTLNGEKWFAWVKGDQGDILVHSDSDHQRDHTIQKGKFYLAEFEDDPQFVDQPHLFLQEGDRYQEWLLPEGLATDSDSRKKLVVTDESVDEKELKDTLNLS